MALKKDPSGKIVLVFSGGKYQPVEQLCCPIGNMSLVEEKCCECTYSFSVSGSIALGCGNSSYYPNRCQPLSFQTAAITIGPLKFAAEISAGPGGITVDDELIVNGSVFQPGLYLVTLNPGSTAYTNPSPPPNCIEFAGGASACNGLHTIPEGTIITTIAEGGTATIAAGDNHGINLSMSGQIVIKPLAAP
jgi:hypothetical protein